MGRRTSVGLAPDNSMPSNVPQRFPAWKAVAAMCLAFAGVLGGLGPARFARADAGRLVLSVVDRTSGQPIPCRMHLKAAHGKPRRPDNVPCWDDHFVVPGQITLKLPLGHYSFELERGPEYVTRTGHFTIERFADDSREVDLYRFTNMAADGWWSGDLDVRRPRRDIELLMQAEDLHVVPLQTWWDTTSIRDARSLAGPWLLSCDTNRFCHLMAGAQTRAGGTLLFFNLGGPLDLTSKDPEDPPAAALAEQARRQPDMWIDVTRPYAWDLPVLVALGLVDSIQVAHGNLGRNKAIASEAGGKARDAMRFPGPWGNAQWSQAIYFHLLECGLRIPPSAGSGSGIGPNPAGYNRVYVHVDGPLTWEAWWASFRAGRVVVTNGPLLRPSVHGQLPGHVFHAEAGQTLTLEIGLTLSTRDPISYLEILKDGKVEHSIRFKEYAASGKLPNVQFDRSGWFLIRAVTDVQTTYRFAMTGPYYVDIGGTPRISRQSAQFFLDWVMERARQIRVEDPDRRRAILQYHRAARDFWQGLLDQANTE